MARHKPKAFPAIRISDAFNWRNVRIVSELTIVGTEEESGFRESVSPVDGVRPRNAGFEQPSLGVQSLS
jgi:hypothetical protein